MKIKLTSVMVNDQQKALKFYTDVLGFIKKTEIDMGDYKWLTVESTEEQHGTELLLEPTAFAPAQTYQQALFEAKIPATIFHVANLDAEYERLKDLGVEFTGTPMAAGMVKMATFNDTCGNLIRLVQVN